MGSTAAGETSGLVPWVRLESLVVLLSSVIPITKIKTTTTSTLVNQGIDLQAF